MRDYKDTERVDRRIKEMIKQNVVFVENKAGSLKRVTGILADNGINIYGFACFDAPEFALFRMITNQADEAEKLLSENGYMNRVTEVIAVDLKDEVGGLNTVLHNVIPRYHGCV